MKNKGWVKFHREQFNHWISKKPFCDGYAWTYLYTRANFKKNMVNFRNEYIEVERGQFLTSKLQLQRIFGWTYRHVENFLLALKNDENITYRTTNRYIVITIINYEFYQGDEEQNEEQNEEQVKNRLGTGLERGNTNKNVLKNVNNEKKEKKEKKISFNFKTNLFNNLTIEQMEEYEKKYPDIDVYEEEKKMTDWLIGEKVKKDNGQSNKIPKDFSRFINNWLRRSK